MSKALHRIIEKSIKSWEHSSEGPGKRRYLLKNQKCPVITISREYGARGAMLAEYMGEKIGFKVWNRDILQAIGGKLEKDEEYLEELDEVRRDTIEDMVTGFMKNISTNVSYLRTLKQVIKTIEEHGNSLIVGRGGNYICEHEDALHVRIVSPVKKRITDYASRNNISKSEAREIIQKTDKERADFIQYSFDKDVNNASDYDLILNSGIFDLHDMMLIITDAYEKKTGIELKVLN